jgi:hypothetical protein
MNSLLKDLDAKAGKIAYQTYTFEHGIEKLTVLVPLKDAPAFQVEFADSEDKSKKALLEIVTRFAGKVRS